MDLKDFGQLASDGQYANKAIFELVPRKDFEPLQGTLENLEIAKEQFEVLSDRILEILHRY